MDMYSCSTFGGFAESNWLKMTSFPTGERGAEEFVSLFYDPLIFMNPGKMRVKVNSVLFFYYFPVLARSGNIGQVTHSFQLKLSARKSGLNDRVTTLPPFLCFFRIFPSPEKIFLLSDPRIGDNGIVK